MGSRYITSGQSISEEYRKRARGMRKVMTPMERRLWEALRGHRLNGLHFRRQQPISTFIADFICLAAGVVVEVDGGIHTEQRAYDANRDEFLTSHNLVILRFTNDQVAETLPAVLASIARTCAHRLANTPPPPCTSAK
jgi:very-short-patch-repair endonuclease